MKYRNILIFIAGLALLVIAMLSFSDDILSPYVPFREAISNPGSYVQVIGSLDRSTPITHSEGSYAFTIIDKDGVRMKIVHAGIIPQNFNHAEQAVILGKYTSDGGFFEADKVLVKCPSKYEREN
ncbi:MAG: cytochrome c maturation protein CcmE [Spirochaetes bacterium]|nr:cytochrome c maturation protein CcmE [Spirochaetota bacterium]